jgi:SAM-dependent methyltransferase
MRAVDVALDAMPVVPRERFGLGLTGEVLEIGPGTVPFPTAPGARVRYADRSIPGGRDASFPELVGTPHGPDADYELDLDMDGLGGVGDRAFDAVVLSHVIEHVADPIRALKECHRVLRRSGRLVLVVPHRHTTFDSRRPGTSFAHVLAEHRSGVTEIDREHILEFCHSVYSSEPRLPEEIRELHDPDRLDDDLLALHRRRSIHVHCWNAEEMASMLVALAAVGEVGWRLVDLFLHDDPGASDIEFGLVLEPAPVGTEAAADLIDAWVTAILGDEARDPGRVGTFTEALARDLLDGTAAEASTRALVARPGVAAAAWVTQARAEAQAAVDERNAARVRAETAWVALAARESEVAELHRSRSYRVGRLATAPVRAVRRVTGRNR